MTATQLLDFVRHRMRMSHVYQPVMLLKLIKLDGRATEEEIATALLKDRSQSSTTSRGTMGRVLRTHGIVRREVRTYHLECYSSLATEERAERAGAWRKAHDEYVAKRGSRIWAHRTQSAGYISGTLRYDVFKAAKFRCELYGVAWMSARLKSTTSSRELGADPTTRPTCRLSAIAATR